MSTMRDVVVKLGEQHNKLNSWRLVSIEFYNEEIPPGTLSSIAKGREPKDHRHRELLDLPVICMECGRQDRKLKSFKWRDLPTKLLRKAIEYRG